MEQDSSAAYLRARSLPGQRVTPQRLLLLGLIRRAQGHVDADEIYRRARERNPHISLSTVYRALRLFKKMGLVEELHFNEEHHHYEVKPPSQHYHMVCMECGKVIEFLSPLIGRIVEEVNREYDFTVTGGEVSLVGYCQECRSQETRTEAKLDE
ncbi:MAG: transcriptional repressor [Chloroflexi bacterium]|nr:transcriptional repressor [Chloroflexota bacterium]